MHTDTTDTDPHGARLARDGLAAKDLFWSRTRQFMADDHDRAESPYRIVPQHEDQERAPRIDWLAVEGDEAKYWTSLAICADAARRLAQLWAAPTPGCSGPGPVRIEERELFYALVETLRDTPAGVVRDALDGLNAIPVDNAWTGRNETLFACDCLGVAPYSTAHLAAELQEPLPALLQGERAQRLEAVIADVEAARG